MTGTMLRKYHVWKRDVGSIESYPDRTRYSSDRSCHFANKGGPDRFNGERMSPGKRYNAWPKENNATEGITITVSTLGYGRYSRKRTKLIAKIVLNVEGETTLHDVGQETREGNL